MGSLCWTLAAAVAVLSLCRAGALDCAAEGERDCLRKPGCHWFSYERGGGCDLCDQWFQAQSEVTGCHDWSTDEYCQLLIFAGGKQKFTVEPTSPSFHEAVEHYHIAAFDGEDGSPVVRRSRCSVYCDLSAPYTCRGQKRPLEELKGVNYGGRFVPEEYLGIDGSDELFRDVQWPQESANGMAISGRSICDVAAHPDAARRLSSFLDRSIQFEHFQAMAAQGFNMVRLPMGYWNLVDIPDAAPEAPLLETDRWLRLQLIMPSSAYSKWINRIFTFAAQAGLRVLLDLHGAPGGQTGNAFTGCDMGKGNAYFESDWNRDIAVKAIEAMAEICMNYEAVCYGVELLNEPDTKISRDFLREYYERAAIAARRHLAMEKPLIVMDWTSQLKWWQRQRPFTYSKHGHIVFGTHLYSWDRAIDQAEARKAYSGDIELLADFRQESGYETLVTEWAVQNHGRGLHGDPFDFHSFCHWMIHQCNHYGLGSAVWNFDAAPGMAVWGPVSGTLSRRIKWRQILHTAHSSIPTNEIIMKVEEYPDLPRDVTKWSNTPLIVT